MVSRESKGFWLGFGLGIGVLIVMILVAVVLNLPRHVRAQGPDPVVQKLDAIIQLLTPQQSGPAAPAQADVPATGTLTADQQAALAAPVVELDYDCSQPAKSSWTDGKYQTFPRGFVNGVPVMQYLDFGTLGPDVDTIIGIDVQGIVPFGGAKVFQGSNPTETRFVMVKRTDINYLQLKDILGGDQFDVWRIADDGGDVELARQTYCHAVNSAREHQIVYYVGDWGAFLKQFGKGEPTMINRLVHCQVPAMPEIGINACDFAY